MITLEIPPGVDPASDWQPRPPAGQRWVDDGWGAYTLERIETPAPKIQPMQAPKVAMPIAPVRPRIRNWADEESDSTTVDDDPSSSIETPKIGEPVTDGSRPVELPVPMSRQSSQATAGFAEQLIDFDDVLSCAEIPALSPSSLTASAMLTPQYDGSERPNGNTETIRQTNGVNGPAASSSSSNGTAARSSSKSQPDTDDQPLDRQSGRPSAQLSRKASSPMMPAFMVSAPGKVIVFGEHAVVHGKSAMAASISLRSYLLVTSLSKSQRTVQLRFPDVGLDHTWEIDALPWNQFSAPDKKKSYYDFVTTLDPDLQDSLAPFLSDISPDAKPEQRKVHSAAAMAFLYLFLSLGSQSFPPAIYTLRSTIPIGAGLGSSASIAVCLSTALLLQIRALSGPHPDQPDSESALQLERINRWAFVAEMCIHGNPSGVDNTVSSHGKAVIFKRSDYRQPPTVIPLRYFPELPLLIVNTKQPRSTAAEVAKVAALKFSKPTITASILDAIHSVTEDAHALMTSPHFLPTPPPGLSQAPTPNPTPDSIRKLGQLMRINHGLLVSLGVSHPRLERVRAIIDHPAAAYGYTKLTGAGGGGCAISLVDPDTSDADLRAFCEQLRGEGFEVFRTRIGGGGVGVLWPAVLRTGNGEEGGEEIGLERFLSVRGTEGVERLVGVGEGRRREEWKYWRA